MNRSVCRKTADLSRGEGCHSQKGHACKEKFVHHGCRGSAVEAGPARKGFPTPTEQRTDNTMGECAGKGAVGGAQATPGGVNMVFVGIRSRVNRKTAV